MLHIYVNRLKFDETSVKQCKIWPFDHNHIIFDSLDCKIIENNFLFEIVKWNGFEYIDVIEYIFELNFCIFVSIFFFGIQLKNKLALLTRQGCICNWFRFEIYIDDQWRTPSMMPSQSNSTTIEFSLKIYSFILNNQFWFLHKMSVFLLYYLFIQCQPNQTNYSNSFRTK